MRVVVWCALNVVAFVRHWYPYPFILLNLLVSIQAAYTGPVLLLAGNRSAQRDRLMAEHDDATNEKAEAIVLRILSELVHNTVATLAIAQKSGAQLSAHSAEARRETDPASASPPDWDGAPA